MILVHKQVSVLGCPDTPQLSPSVTWTREFPSRALQLFLLESATGFSWVLNVGPLLHRQEHGLPSQSRPPSTGTEAGRVSGGCAAVDGCSPSRRLSRTHLRIAPPTGKAAGIFTITPGVLIPQHFKHRMPTGPEKTFKYNQVLEAGGHWCDMQSVHSSYRRPPGVTSRVGQGMLQEALRAPALVPRTHTFKPSPLSHVSGVHFNSISPGFNWLPHRCTGPGPGSGLGQDETQHVPGTCDRPGPVQISSPGSTQDCPVMHTIPPPPILPTCT